MNLDDELDSLGHICDGNRGHNAFDCQRAKFIRSEIEQRDTDYEQLLRAEWEVGGQLDGMQLVRWAFRRGWEVGNQHGRNQAFQDQKEREQFYR